MRVFRVLICTVVLMAAAFGQSSSSSTSTGTDPQNPNQPQQNPIDEPKKQADDKRAPAQSSFNMGDAASAGEDQLLGEVRLMTRNTEIGGDQTRSFMTDGMNNLAEFNFFQDRRFLVTRRLQILSMFRGTNDRSIDPEQNSLQKAYIRIYGPRDEYIFGDALVNFSRLAFNQNIRGVNTTWKLGDTWKLSTAGGVFIDRWGSLWKSYSDTPGRPYMSGVFGMRLEKRVSRNNTIGLNFSSSDDVLDSLPEAPAGTTPLPASNRVGTIDTKLAFGGFRVDSEFAASTTKFDTRLPLGYASDWGARMEAQYKYKKLSFRGAYVRYQPNFASVNARQISDLQDWIFRTSYELTDWLTVDGTARRSNDDLKKQLPFERVTWGPEGRLIFHDMPFYRRLIFETGYRQRMTTASDSSIDRYVRMPYAEFTIPYHTTFFNIGWERREAVDQLTASQTTNTNRVYVGLRGIYDFGGWHLNPVLRFELERESSRPGLDLVPYDPSLYYDSNRLGSAQLYVEAPRYFIAELQYRQSGATIYGPAGYRRPSYRAALTYKIANDENMLLIFGFERNNNFYFSQPNFDERQYGVTLVYKFGKRGR